MSAPLTVRCPECRGAGEFALPAYSRVPARFATSPCPYCAGAGEVVVRCDHPGCPAPAVRRQDGDPGIAYCDEHDTCALCDAKPVAADDLCKRCLWDLAVVSPVVSAA